MIRSIAILALAASSASAKEARPADRLAIFALHSISSKGVFSLELFPDGSAEYTGSGNVVRRRTLTSTEMEQLHRMVAEQRIFDLQPRHGICYTDGPLRVMKVQLGTRTVRLSLCSLEPRSMSSTAHEEAARALRLWVAVRSLFPDRYAIDDRAEDGAFLDGQ